MVVGLVSLTACSGENYDAFCDVAENADERSAALDELVLGDEVLTAALEGDLAPLNTWGDEASAELQTLLDDFDAARNNAPDEEAEAALDDLIAGISVIEQMAGAAADAADLDQFIDAVSELESDFNAFEGSSTDTAAVLDDKTEQYCA